MNLSIPGMNELSIPELFEIEGGVNWGVVAVGAIVTVGVAAVYVGAAIATSGASAGPLARTAAVGVFSGVAIVVAGFNS